VPSTLSLFRVLAVLIFATMLFVAPWRQAKAALPDRSRDRIKCAGIRDAREWPNPFVIVAATGVTVISCRSRRSSPQSRDMAVDQLASFLRGLPRTAWPCGRVVGLQESGVRGSGDGAIISENLEKVKSILKTLRVRVDGWPSAWAPLERPGSCRISSRNALGSGLRSGAHPFHCETKPVLIKCARVGNNAAG